MPTYEYKCAECGIRFERLQHFAEEPLKVCPECEGPVQRVIQPVGIIFKGKGFYVTDNRGNNASLAPKSDAKSNGDGESAKAEAKPASKSDD